MVLVSAGFGQDENASVSNSGGNRAMVECDGDEDLVAGLEGGKDEGETRH